VQARQNVVEVVTGTVDEADGVLDGPVDLHELPRPRLAVEHVDVLRDDPVQHAAAFELDEHRVRTVGLLVAQPDEALAVELPEARRVGAPGVDVRDLHRVDVRPQAGPRRAEVGDVGRHGDPRAGQGHDRTR